MALGLGTSPEELARASIEDLLDTLKRISRGQNTIFSIKIPNFIVYGLTRWINVLGGLELWGSIISFMVFPWPETVDSLK
jgi:hypothetical protein